MTDKNNKERENVPSLASIFSDLTSLIDHHKKTFKQTTEKLEEELAQLHQKHQLVVQENENLSKELSSLKSSVKEKDTITRRRQQELQLAKNKLIVAKALFNGPMKKLTVNADQSEMSVSLDISKTATVNNSTITKTTTEKTNKTKTSEEKEKVPQSQSKKPVESSSASPVKKSDKKFDALLKNPALKNQLEKILRETLKKKLTNKKSSSSTSTSVVTTTEDGEENMTITMDFEGENKRAKLSDESQLIESETPINSV